MTYNKAPERIWAEPEKYKGAPFWEAGTFCTVDDGGEEYVRADLRPAVKPLEWETDTHLLEDDATSTSLSAFGRYYAKENIWWGPGVVVSTGYTSENMAQCAAQTDYERRILSTIDLAPITPAQAAINEEYAVDTIEEIIGETHDIDVTDRVYAQNIVNWIKRHHPDALRAIAEGESHE